MFGAGVLARDRVHGVRAQRMLDRRALGARLQRLVDPRRVEREVLADAAGVDGDAGVLADEVLLVVGDLDVLRIVSSTRCPATTSRAGRVARARRAGPAGCPSAPRRRGARRRPRRACWRSVATSCSCARLLRRGRARRGGRTRSTRAASCPSSGCARACRPRSRRRRRGPRRVVSPCSSITRPPFW